MADDSTKNLKVALPEAMVTPPATREEVEERIAQLLLGMRKWTLMDSAARKGFAEQVYSDLQAGGEKANQWVNSKINPIDSVFLRFLHYSGQGTSDAIQAALNGFGTLVDKTWNGTWIKSASDEQLREAAKLASYQWEKSQNDWWGKIVGFFQALYDATTFWPPSFDHEKFKTALNVQPVERGALAVYDAIYKATGQVRMAEYVSAIGTDSHLQPDAIPAYLNPKSSEVASVVKYHDRQHYVHGEGMKTFEERVADGYRSFQENPEKIGYVVGPVAATALLERQTGLVSKTARGVGAVAGSAGSKIVQTGKQLSLGLTGGGTTSSAAGVGPWGKTAGMTAADVATKEGMALRAGGAARAGLGLVARGGTALGRLAFGPVGLYVAAGAMIFDSMVSSTVSQSDENLLGSIAKFNALLPTDPAVAGHIPDPVLRNYALSVIETYKLCDELTALRAKVALMQGQQQTPTQEDYRAIEQLDEKRSQAFKVLDQAMVEIAGQTGIMNSSNHLIERNLQPFKEQYAAAQQAFKEHGPAKIEVTSPPPAAKAAEQEVPPAAAQEPVINFGPSASLQSGGLSATALAAAHEAIIAQTRQAARSVANAGVMPDSPSRPFARVSDVKLVGVTQVAEVNEGDAPRASAAPAASGAATQVVAAV